MSNVKKPRRSILTQLVIVLVFLAVVWFSFAQNVLAPAKQSGVPERLGKLELASSVKGSEAVAQVSKLHGINVVLVDALLAEYGSGKEKVTVWVGEAENSQAALELIERMAAKITQSQSGFSNVRQLTISKSYHTHNVFQVDGPGGQHFFYNSKQLERVVWLTIQSANPMAILEEAIDRF